MEYGEIYGSYMENLWKIYGYVEYMVHIWKIYGYNNDLTTTETHRSLVRIRGIIPKWANYSGW